MIAVTCLRVCVFIAVLVYDEEESTTRDDAIRKATSCARMPAFVAGWLALRPRGRSDMRLPCRSSQRSAVGRGHDLSVRIKPKV